MSIFKALRPLETAALQGPVYVLSRRKALRNIVRSVCAEAVWVQRSVDLTPVGATVVTDRRHIAVGVFDARVVYAISYKGDPADDIQAISLALRYIRRIEPSILV